MKAGCGRVPRTSFTPNACRAAESSRSRLLATQAALHPNHHELNVDPLSLVDSGFWLYWSRPCLYIVSYSPSVSFDLETRREQVGTRTLSIGLHWT